MSENTAKIEVPDEILDRVVEISRVYAAGSKARWLQGFEADRAELVEKSATYNNLHTLSEIEALGDSTDATTARERRELHRSILQDAAKNIKGDIPDQPIMVYMGGSMGSGKTELRHSFQQRIDSEKAGIDALLFEDENLENAYQAYKEAGDRLMTTDVDKTLFPEFHEQGWLQDENFALIRPEFVGLQNAARTWAKSLKAHTVMEQLGDGVTDKWLQDNVRADGYRLVMIGVTADDPATNLAHLRERGDHTSDETLGGAIRKFSLDDGYKKWSGAADMAVLISVSSDYTPTVIHAAQNGLGTFIDNDAFKKFESYGEMSVDEIVQAMRTKQEQKASHEIGGLDEFSPNF